MVISERNTRGRDKAVAVSMGVEKQVALDLIDPNPHRDLEIDPYDEQRLLSLQQSFKAATFWSRGIQLRASHNKVGRYEAVFAHNRIEAARRCGIVSAVFELVDIDDEQMLIRMMQENAQQRSSGSDMARVINAVCAINCFLAAEAFKAMFYYRAAYHDFNAHKGMLTALLYDYGEAFVKKFGYLFSMPGQTIVQNFAASLGNLKLRGLVGGDRIVIYSQHHGQPIAKPSVGAALKFIRRDNALLRSTLLKIQADVLSWYGTHYGSIQLTKDEERCALLRKRFTDFCSIMDDLIARASVDAGSVDARVIGCFPKVTSASSFVEACVPTRKKSGQMMHYNVPREEQYALAKKIAAMPSLTAVKIGVEVEDYVNSKLDPTTKLDLENEHVRQEVKRLWMSFDARMTVATLELEKLKRLCKDSSRLRRAFPSLRIKAKMNVDEMLRALEELYIPAHRTQEKNKADDSPTATLPM